MAANGFFAAQTILDEVQTGIDLAKEEIFGRAERDAV